VRTDESGTDVVQHLELAPVSSRGEIEALLRTAAEFRSTASTLANPQSSRSHCFTQLHLEGGGSLTFVDLAGAEGKEDLAAHCEMGNAEERLKEMKEINGSLGDLKECIRLNLEKAKGRSARVHVPYRRSLLTRLLRRALDPELQGRGGEGGGGGGHSTTFLAHVAPGGGSQFKGTVNTLNVSGERRDWRPPQPRRHQCDLAGRRGGSGGLPPTTPNLPAFAPAAGPLLRRFPEPPPLTQHFSLRAQYAE
jgi:kinesin family protein 2/24